MLESLPRTFQSLLDIVCVSVLQFFRSTLQPSSYLFLSSPSLRQAMLCLTQLPNCLTHFWQTLEGSFSAVSSPNFTTKYSLESSWRDLSNLHSFAPFRAQNLSKISSRNLGILSKKPRLLFFSVFLIFLRDFCLNWTKIVGISQIIQKMLQEADNMNKFTWKLETSLSWVRIELGLS